MNSNETTSQHLSNVVNAIIDNRKEFNKAIIFNRLEPTQTIELQAPNLVHVYEY